MKYLLQFIAYFSAMTGLSAQNADFAPLGAKWYYTEEQYAPPSILPHIVEVVTKEMYQGKLCSKLVGPGYGSLPFDPCYLYTSGDTVFFYSLLSNQFEMLYDFSAEVGDSWVIGGLSAAGDLAPVSSDTITVDSISMIHVGGSVLKVWHITNTIWYDWGDRIIEKMGNDHLFAPRFGLYDVLVWGLRCFDSAGAQYHLVSYPCDTTFLTTGTYDAEWPAKIDLAPNPFHDRISITSERPFGNAIFFLQNPFGRVVAIYPLNQTVTEVFTEALPPGVYYYAIVVDAQKTKEGKLIKTW